MRIGACRHLFVFFVFLIMGVFLVSRQAPAAASGLSPARKTLEISTARILACIKNPDYVNPATRVPLRRQIEEEVLYLFDFMEFSSRTVGQRWRTFTPEQQKGFSDVFADLLISTYVNKIDGYNGEEAAYVGEVASEDRVEVRTVVTLKDGKKIPVAYRMLSKNGSWRVYDVLIENLSLVKNYRAQFQDILNRDPPDRLIERIRDKSREVRQQHEAK